VAVVGQGAQNERTALAWQRTALSLLAGSAAVARLTVGRLGPLALLCVVVAVPAAGWVFLESRSRYRRDAELTGRDRPRGGRAPAVLALLTVTIALTELAALLVSV
jgi:uncharacterized membrane protein YidH (DUF202 family)